MRGGLTAFGVSCALTLLLAGCGGSSSSGAVATRPALTPAQQARADARAMLRARIALERTFAPNPYPEPGPTAPHTRPLRRLIVHEIKRGRGPALTGDERVYADLVKTYWRSGRKALVAWGPRRSEFIELASAFDGMRRGMIGMRPGGRRTIAMPKAISDTHPPDGSARYVAAQLDVVLRKIITE